MSVSKAGQPRRTTSEPKSPAPKRSVKRSTQLDMFRERTRAELESYDHGRSKDGRESLRRQYVGASETSL